MLMEWEVNDIQTLDQINVVVNNVQMECVSADMLSNNTSNVL